MRPPMISTNFFVLSDRNTDLIVHTSFEERYNTCSDNFASSASTYGTYNVRGEKLSGMYFLLTLQEVLSVSNVTFKI